MENQYKLFFKRIAIILACITFLVSSGCVVTDPHHRTPTQITVVTDNVTGQEPLPTTAAVTVFANEAVVTAYSYNYVTYKQTLNAVRPYFTTRGYVEFERAFLASNDLYLVRDNKFVASAVARGAPVILREGLVNGVYTWEVQMPLLVTYENAKEKTQKSLVVNLMVQQVSRAVNSRGLGVNHIIARHQ